MTKDGTPDEIYWTVFHALDDESRVAALDAGAVATIAQCATELAIGEPCGLLEVLRREAIELTDIARTRRG